MLSNRAQSQDQRQLTPHSQGLCAWSCVDWAENLPCDLNLFPHDWGLGWRFWGWRSLPMAIKTHIHVSVCVCVCAHGLSTWLRLLSRPIILKINPETAASKLLENLLKMRILSPHPGPTESDSLGWGTYCLCFNKFPASNAYSSLRSLLYATSCMTLSKLLRVLCLSFHNHKIEKIIVPTSLG